MVGRATRTHRAAIHREERCKQAPPTVGHLHTPHNLHLPTDPQAPKTTPSGREATPTAPLRSNRKIWAFTRENQREGEGQDEDHGNPPKREMAPSSVTVVEPGSAGLGFLPVPESLHQHPTRPRARATGRRSSGVGQAWAEEEAGASILAPMAAEAAPVSWTAPTGATPSTRPQTPSHTRDHCSPPSQGRLSEKATATRSRALPWEKRRNPRRHCHRRARGLAQEPSLVVTRCGEGVGEAAGG
jgi:hypothetical protein